MRERYLGRVGGDSFCVPVVVVPGLSLFGMVLFCHDGGHWMSRGDIGATHDLAQRGVGRSGRESVMAVDQFC